jgi:hypothetical protein
MRSFRIRGPASPAYGATAPNEFNVQFYFERFWYNLQTVSHTEDCVNITTDYQSVLGVDVDSSDPILESVEPPYGFEGVSPYPRVLLTFNENVQVAAGQVIQFVDSGANAYCGSIFASDDTFIQVPTSQSPLAIADGGGSYINVANMSAPNVLAINNSVLISPSHKYLRSQRWYCLSIPRGAIQDAAGNAFFGFSDSAYRFKVGASAYDVRAIMFLTSDPPPGSIIIGEDAIRIRLFFNKPVVIHTGFGSLPGYVTFIPSINAHNESFNISLSDTTRVISPSL